MSLRRATWTLLALGLVASLVAAGPAAASSTPTSRDTVTYAIPGDAVFPEGVTFDFRTGFFYVSSTTDGTIFRGHIRDRDRELETFLPGGADGRTTAIGLQIDLRGRLYVAGGPTGQMWVYDTRTRELIRRFDTGLREGTFVNDVSVDWHGNAYFTDSLNPVLYRVPDSAVVPGAPPAAPETFIEFEGTPLQYQAGFNVNGIATSLDGEHLVVVQSNVGKLFRLGIDDRSVAEIAVSGGEVTAGDGLVLLGSVLFVVRNQLGLVSTVLLDRGLDSGRVVNEYSDPAFMFPTTAALSSDGRLLVVNSQFDQRGGNPVLPFTVAGAPLLRVLFG